MVCTRVSTGTVYRPVTRIRGSRLAEEDELFSRIDEDYEDAEESFPGTNEDYPNDEENFYTMNNEDYDEPEANPPIPRMYADYLREDGEKFFDREPPSLEIPREDAMTGTEVILREDAMTTTDLISHGVALLRQGSQIIEKEKARAQVKMVDEGTQPSPAILHETADKLQNACDHRLKLLQDENELLKMTNKMLVAQCQRQEQQPKKVEKQEEPKKVDVVLKGVVCGAPTVLKSKLPLPSGNRVASGLTPCSKSKSPVRPSPVSGTVSSPSAPPPSKSPVRPESGDVCGPPLVDPSPTSKSPVRPDSGVVCVDDCECCCEDDDLFNNQVGASRQEQTKNTPLETILTDMECLESRVWALEGIVSKLEKTCEDQRNLIGFLQEKLHRQEIRYHDTISKFDATHKSMKLMFESLKSSICKN